MPNGVGYILFKIRDYLYLNKMNGLYDNLLMAYFGLKTFDPYSEYFYVEPLETGSIYIMSNGFTQDPKVEYSTDKINWTEAQTYVVNTLDRVYIRRKKDSWHHTSQAIGDNLNLPMKCNVGGNILSLIYGDEFNGQKVFPEGSSYNFDGLFRADDQVGNKIVDASKLILPTNVTEACFLSMFEYCSELISAPELPASTLAPYCYYFTFYGCSSLKYIKVGFTAWPDMSSSSASDYNATFGWTQLTVNTTGTFVCPSSLPQNFNASGNNSLGSNISGYTNAIPSGWTVEEI